MIREGTYRVDSGYALTQELFRRRQSPTALVCGNDWMALGALIALSGLSLRVPQDVSLVGYDDLPDLADILHPSITTVRRHTSSWAAGPAS